MTVPSNAPRMEINYSFGWTAGMYVVPLVMLFGYLAFAPPVQREAHIFLIAMFWILSVVGLIGAIHRWTRKGPLLVIDENGITDNVIGYGLIRWDEITEAYLRRTRAGKILILNVKDPKRFEHVKRPIRLRALPFLPGDLQLEVAETDHKPEDVLAEIDRRMGATAPSRVESTL